MNEKKLCFNTYQQTTFIETSELEPKPTDVEADPMRNNTMNEKKSELETQQRQTIRRYLN